MGLLLRSNKDSLCDGTSMSNSGGVEDPHKGRYASLRSRFIVTGGLDWPFGLLMTMKVVHSSQPNFFVLCEPWAGHRLEPEQVW